MNKGQFSMDKIVDLLQKQGVHAYLEQTGGGTATIFAGQVYEVEDGWKVCRVAAGPGHFRDSSWKAGIGDVGEFYVGPYDEETGEEGAMVQMPQDLKPKQAVMWAVGAIAAYAAATWERED